MAYIEVVEVIGICLFSIVVSELLGWVMVYSQQDYINARNSLDLLGAKLDAAKSDDSKSNKANKKTADLSSQLTTKARELSVIKFRSNIAMMVTVLISWNVLSSGYEGIVVAKLPFVPLPLIQAMSMRGLSGNDPTECNVYFILALCQMGLRPVLQKLMGMSPTSKYENAGSLFPAAE